MLKFDEDNNEVILTLDSCPGDRFIVVEPTTEKVLMAQGWLSTAPEDKRNGVWLSLKLVSLCLFRELQNGDRHLVKMDDLIARIPLKNSVKDTARLAKCLEFFPIEFNLGSDTEPDSNSDPEPSLDT